MPNPGLPMSFLILYIHSTQNTVFSGGY